MTNSCFDKYADSDRPKTKVCANTECGIASVLAYCSQKCASRVHYLRRKQKLGAAERGSPEHREKIRQQMKAAWSDPNKREVMLAALRTPEYRQGQGRAQKKRWRDSEYRAAVTKKIRDYGAAPEVRDTRSDQKKSLWLDPEYRKQMRAKLKAAWADPVRRARRLKKIRKAWAGADGSSWRELMVEAHAVRKALKGNALKRWEAGSMQRRRARRSARREVK